MPWAGDSFTIETLGVSLSFPTKLQYEDGPPLVACGLLLQIP